MTNDVILNRFAPATVWAPPRPARPRELTVPRPTGWPYAGPPPIVPVSMDIGKGKGQKKEEREAKRELRKAHLDTLRASITATQKFIGDLRSGLLSSASTINVQPNFSPTNKQERRLSRRLDQLLTRDVPRARAFRQAKEELAAVSAEVTYGAAPPPDAPSTPGGIAYTETPSTPSPGQVYDPSPAAPPPDAYGAYGGGMVAPYDLSPAAPSPDAYGAYGGGMVTPSGYSPDASGGGAAGADFYAGAGAGAEDDTAIEKGGNALIYIGAVAGGVLAITSLLALLKRRTKR